MAIEHNSNFASLVSYLNRVPAIVGSIGAGESEGIWWVKFSIEITHPLAWQTVQELGHVLNYVSVNERLPVVFKPVSPPPYMNGGPEEYLSWVIETESVDFSPDICMKWLEGRLPDPVDELEQWNSDDLE